MKKDFLSSLIDELTQLRDEQKKTTIPTPLSPAAVFKVIDRVIKEHQITAEELMSLISIRSMLSGGSDSVTTAEMRVVKELRDNEED